MWLLDHIIARIDLIDLYAARLFNLLTRRLDAQGLTLEAQSGRLDLIDLDQATQATALAKQDLRLWCVEQQLARITSGTGSGTPRLTARPARANGRRRRRASTESAG